MSYTRYEGQTSSRDDRGTDYTIFKIGEDRYRVHVVHWNRWQGEGGRAYLLPSDEDPWSPDYEPQDPDDEPRSVKYGVYTEQQVRQLYPAVFAANNDPNVVDID